MAGEARQRRMSKTIVPNEAQGRKSATVLVAANGSRPPCSQSAQNFV
jgi:hypothetical protein